jgi:hypothetical protein
MNDLQFLSGPSVADIAPTPGEEVIEGSANDDLAAFGATGQRASATWPKLTGDWTVANPAIGSFGTLETASGASQVVVSGTRNGRLSIYKTTAATCSDASWPKFHHDLANSGDLDRDAVSPGTPSGAAISGGRLTFSSPGDDLLCGTPKGYEVRTSDKRITPENFGDAREAAAHGPAVAAGQKATLDLSGADLGRWVAVRAVDDQGNVGRPALIDTKPHGAKRTHG